MILTELKIHHLRTISSAHLLLNNRFNFIVGPNGSGKTSILEALYLLSCGHSFRSREIAPVITQGEQQLTVFARSQDQETISIQKSHLTQTQIKLNSQPCFTTSELAYALPAQVFYSDIFQIIDAGSSVRRSVLDWGLFHVKHEYLVLWKQYRKVLKQRNALLKMQAPYKEFIPWDEQLSQIGEQLHELRNNYFILWKESFMRLLPLLTETNCSIEYFKGWDKKTSGRSLFEVLEESFLSDKQKTYTQHGPHQADIVIENQNTKAKNILSRGQQKIILIALKLAQSQFLKKDCLYLFDDVSAELDEVHQINLMKYLSKLQGQFVITSILPIQFKEVNFEKESSVFTISKGNVSRETF